MNNQTITNKTQTSNKQTQISYKQNTDKLQTKHRQVTNKTQMSNGQMITDKYQSYFSSVRQPDPAWCAIQLCKTFIHKV